jgi:AraC-like DNA-binding protein
VGRWALATRAPAPALARYVSAYEGYREFGRDPIRRLEPAFAGVPVIISFDCHWDVVADGGRAPTQHQRLSSFIAGLNDGYAVVQSPGGANCMQVNFTPTGALRFLGTSLDGLHRQTLDLADVLGRAGHLLVEQLYCAGDWATRFELLERALCQRFARAPDPPPLIELGWQRIAGSGGRVAIADLAHESGYSREHVSRAFRQHFGLSAKALARIVRFNRAMHLAGEGRVRGWTEIALQTGYADQSHLIREFRALAGTTPGALPEYFARDGLVA